MRRYLWTFAFLFGALISFAEPLKPETLAAVKVLATHGKVFASPDGKAWRLVDANAELLEGTLVRTSEASSADLLLHYNGSVFRLTENGELRVEALKREDTGVETITQTRLNVVKGDLIGSQRKLHKPSVLEIATKDGMAFIVGTEYVVNASGAVTVLSGSVQVTYNLPGNKGSVQVTVSAGYSFDPTTQKVVPTKPAYLQNIIADVNAVKANAEVYRTGGATIVIKPDEPISPTTPKGNNGVGNGVDPQPPGNPPVNDGPGTGPGKPGNK